MTRNPFIDLLTNREPISISRLITIVAATLLWRLDAAIHFTEEPELTYAILLITGMVIDTVYARLRAWSPESVAKVTGTTPESLPPVPPGDSRAQVGEVSAGQALWYAFLVVAIVAIVLVFILPRI